MKNYRFILLSLLLLIVQVFICNYFGLSRFVLVSLLPAILLMLPQEYGGVVTMLIAFAAGFAVDFFSTGMLGLTSAALVPAALLRRPVIAMVFGDELSSRNDQVSLSHLGVPKMTLAMLILCSVFLLVYVWIDSAGTSGFWTGALRFALSVLVSTPLCVFVAAILRP